MTTARRSAALSIVTIVAALIVVAAPVLVLAGCGDEEDTTSTAAPTTSTTASTTTTTTQAPATTSVPSTETSTTTEPSTTTTTEALSSAETLLPNGHIRAMGFIDQIRFDGVRSYIRIDYAEFLTGEEARQAAIEAGYIQPDEDLPNDYFIRNVNPQKREFSVSESVAITTSTFEGIMERPTTWEEFRSFWSGSPPEGAAHLHGAPWWIERDRDMIVKIDEQYTP